MNTKATGARSSVNDRTIRLPSLVESEMWHKSIAHEDAWEGEWSILIGGNPPRGRGGLRPTSVGA